MAVNGVGRYEVGEKVRNCHNSISKTKLMECEVCMYWV
jgi:hypothetical protein